MMFLRNRRWTYSLRALLAILTVLLIVLSLKANRQHRRSAASASLVAKGANLMQTEEEVNRIWKRLCERRKETQIERLMNGVRWFSKYVNGDSFGGIGFHKLPIDATEIDSINVFHEMEIVAITESNLDDDMFDRLRAPNVKTLVLSGTQITDKSTTKLVTYENLQWLELENTAITDDSVPNLLKLKKLEVLRIVGTEITDRGIAEFRHATNLRELSIGGTELKPPRITLSAYEKLKSQLPNCRFAVAGVASE